MDEKRWMDGKLEDTLHGYGRDAWYEKESPCDGQTDIKNEQQKEKDGLPHPLKENCQLPQRKEATPASTLNMIDKEVKRGRPEQRSEPEQDCLMPLNILQFFCSVPFALAAKAHFFVRLISLRMYVRQQDEYALLCFSEFAVLFCTRVKFI